MEDWNWKKMLSEFAGEHGYDGEELILFAFHRFLDIAKKERDEFVGEYMEMFAETDPEKFKDFVEEGYLANTEEGDF